MTKLSYVVSRFPNPTETFVWREMNQLDDGGRFEIDLLSLFAPAQSVVHPSARRWAARNSRPSNREAAIAFAGFAARRPFALLGCVLRTFAATASRPATLVRALATIPLACAHARSAERRGTDHLHAHFATYPALCAWVCSKLTGASFSYTAHAHDIYVNDALMRLTIRDASFVVTISRLNRELLLRHSGEVPIALIRAGIELDAYPFRPRSIPQRETVRGLCVASLKEHKGHEVLLEAIDDPALQRLHLDLIGDGPLRADLEATVGRRGLDDRVRFHGSLDEDGVREALAEADLFVISSRVAADGQMEGLPVALMEAVASGLPVVSTGISAIPELISDGETGWLALPGDVESLRARLTHALDPATPAPDLQQGRQRIEHEFDVAEGAERLSELLADAAR